MTKVATGRQNGVTLRAGPSVAVGIALLGLVAVLLADALVRGRWDVAVLSVPALGLVACAAVEVFLRPGIRVHPGGVTVVNPLVTTEVPWAEVATVTTRFVVIVELRSGASIRCWGAPTAERSRTRQAPESGGQGSPGGLRVSSPHRVIESFTARYSDVSIATATADASPQIRRQWHATTAVVAGALLLLGGAQLLTGL